MEIDYRDIELGKKYHFIDENKARVKKDWLLRRIKKANLSKERYVSLRRVSDGCNISIESRKIYVMDIDIYDLVVVQPYYFVFADFKIVDATYKKLKKELKELPMLKKEYGDVRIKTCRVEKKGHFFLSKK